MIPIVTGDPKVGPASYTRFVLPFAYCLEACRERSPFRVYELAEEPSYWRQHYFTVETADVLYRRAQCFTMRRGEQAFQITRDGRKINVCIANPYVVLFEWPSAMDEPNQQRLSDPLHLGFLIVEAFFPKQDTPVGLDDFLEFNEKFRYWQQLFEGHEKGYKTFLGDCPIGLQPTQRRVRDSDVPEIYFERWASLLEYPIKDQNGKLWSLFPRTLSKKAKDWIRGCPKSQDMGWITYADARTFVWTCAILQEGSHTLKKYFYDELENPEQEPCLYGHWVKLLNTDSPGSSVTESNQSTDFEREWIDSRTYKRWAHLGTLYGFNYHGGAMLGPVDTGGVPIWRHFGEIYFDQVLLLLYLRIVSFNFGRQLNQISARARDWKTIDKVVRETWQKDFRELRWNFALFTNLYEFPLLSNQQQGIETGVINDLW